MSRSEAKSTVLLHAAALQEHFSRLLQIPGRLPLARGSAPTLAQRFKLVSGPAVVTPEQWQAAHAQSLCRGDSQRECSICLQLFRGEPQVLLSCSHVYHSACLRSFERYAQLRCCPLCRCQAYQKKLIDDGARFYMEQCATRIQAAYRAHLARKQFQAMRDLLPPTHPALRRRWVAQKLQRRTDQLVGTVERNSTDIDILFAELDATVRQTQAICSRLDARQPWGAGDAHARQPASPVAPAPPSQRAAPVASRMSPGLAGAATAVDWAGIVQAALGRGDAPECPICLAPLAPALPDLQSDGSGGAASRSAAGGGGSNKASGGVMAVLSCSHIFHGDCLALFEAFQVASEAAPRCPCCRAVYSRIELQ